MQFTYTVTVEVAHRAGKFAGRDEITGEIGAALEDAVASIDLSGIGADGDSEYEVEDSDISEEEQAKPKRDGRRRLTVGHEHTDVAVTHTHASGDVQHSHFRAVDEDAAKLNAPGRDYVSSGRPGGPSDAPRSNEALRLAREAADELARRELTPDSNEAQLVAAFTTIDEALAKGGTLPAAWAQATS